MLVASRSDIEVLRISKSYNFIFKLRPNSTDYAGYHVIKNIYYGILFLYYEDRISKSNIFHVKYAI